MSVKMAFFLQGVGRAVSFIDVIPESADHMVTDSWSPSFSAVEKLLQSLFASLSSLALSNKMQSKICFREELDRCKIHRINEICLELGTFEKFATAIPQTLTIHAKRCLSSREHFHLITWMKLTVFETGWTSGISRNIFQGPVEQLFSSDLLQTSLFCLA